MAGKYFNNPNEQEKGPSGCLVIFLFLWLLLAGSTIIVLIRWPGIEIVALNVGLLIAVTLAIRFIKRH
ncbi:MAG: hypothetical protein JSS77_10260 [Acidobacteria bacterium]|nr:hypothetical protein [Acidobacteriota bacterium]